MTLSSVRFGRFHLGHLRPGQYLGRFAADGETLLEIIQVVNRPVAEYSTLPGRMRLSIPVDSYVLNADTWQYQRGGRYVGWTFDLAKTKSSVVLPDPKRLEALGDSAKKALARKSRRVGRQSLETWESVGGSAAWVPLSRRVAAKMGVDKQARLSNPRLRLDRERIVRTVLLDPAAQLTSTSLKALSQSHPARRPLPLSLSLVGAETVREPKSVKGDSAIAPSFHLSSKGLRGSNPFKRPGFKRPEPPSPPALGF